MSLILKRKVERKCMLILCWKFLIDRGDNFMDFTERVRVQSRVFMSDGY